MSEQNGANYDALSDARMRTEVQEVELPGFGDGKPWKPKLKRLSLLGLARNGKIPNELLSAVTELYQYGTVKTPDLKLAAETMYLIAGEALAEPTLTQLEEAGVPLTDEQLAAIYLYARRGVEAAGSKLVDLPAALDAAPVHGADKALGGQVDGKLPALFDQMVAEPLGADADGHHAGLGADGACPADGDEVGGFQPAAGYQNGRFRV